MSGAVPSEKREPSPFEKFKNFATRIIAVPKEEADEQERKWREDRATNAQEKFSKRN